MSTTFAPRDASQAVQYPSPKQVTFLLNLADDRELGMTRDEMQARIDQGMTGATAKAWITKALTKPYKPKATAAPGYYILGEGDAAEYLVVVANKSGTGTYAKKLVITPKAPIICQGHYDVDGNLTYCGAGENGTQCLGDDGQPAFTNAKGAWVYAPGKGHAVAAMTPMTMDEALAFSHLHGFCFRCGKALKDPKSVKASVGPVCIKKLGLAGVK